MSKADIMNKLSRTFHKGMFQVKKHSPELLVGTGIVAGVAGAVLACKATTKAVLVVEKTKENIEHLNKGAEEGKIEGYLEDGSIGVIPYNAEDAKADARIVYAKTGVELVKLYAPAVALGALSIGCILSGHNIMRKRNIALAAAYTIVDSSFKDYRNRVIERFGKELDRELKYDIREVEVEEKVTNEDGTEQVVKSTVKMANPNISNSCYARCFDETSTAWERDAEYNLMFLRQREKEANIRLRSQGFLFLNDVYEMLGFQKTRAGQEVGWIFDEKHPVGDNYVDFNIYDLRDPDKRAFVNGVEKCIWVDFNVDGPIMHYLP